MAPQSKAAATGILNDPDLDDATKLQLIVQFLNDPQCKAQLLIILDNLEDALDFQTLQIADPALAAFYGQLMTGLRRNSRAIITSRYIPEGTPRQDPCVFVKEALGDFEEHHTLKFFSRDADVAHRIRNNDLPMSVVKQAIPVVGGTPRFLGVVRDLLRKLDAEELRQELDRLASGWKSLEDESDSPGELEQARDKYLTEILGPKLFDRMSPLAQMLLTRLSLSQLPLPNDGLLELCATTTVSDTAEPAQEDPGADALAAAISLAEDYGLLTQFLDRDGPTLYHTPQLWRAWLATPDRLSDREASHTHQTLATFWRKAFESDRESELRVSFMAELEACRHHALGCASLPDLRWATLRLAQTHHRISGFQEARRLLLDLKSWITDHGHPIGAYDVHCLHLTGRCEESLSNWQVARKCYEEALECEFGDSKEDRTGRAAILHNLAGLHVREGDYPVAREKFQRALEIKQQIGDRAGEAATWHNLASIDIREGNYPKARENFQRSLETKQQIGDRAGEAATWHQLASIDVYEGNYPKARENFQRSLEIKQQIGDRAGEAATWHGLASIDLNEGNYPKARENFQRALEMRQQIGDRAGEAATWHNLASIDVYEGNSPKARENFQRALEMRQQIGDRAGEAATWHNLATIDLNEGSYPKARENFQRALEMRQQIGDRAGEAATWHQLATIDLNEGNYPKARENFQRSLEIKQQIGDRAGEAATLYQIGFLAWERQKQRTGILLVATCVFIQQSIGSGDLDQTVPNLMEMAKQLEVSEDGLRELVQEATTAYGADRCQSLIQDAFA